MRSFRPEAHAFLRRLDDDPFLRPGLDGTSVRLEFDEVQVSVAPDRPETAFVEEQGGVVHEIPVDDVPFPWAVHDVRRPVQVGLLLVVCDEKGVVHAVMIP